MHLLRVWTGPRYSRTKQSAMSWDATNRHPPSVYWILKDMVGREEKKWYFCKVHECLGIGRVGFLYYLVIQEVRAVHPEVNQACLIFPPICLKVLFWLWLRLVSLLSTDYLLLLEVSSVNRSRKFCQWTFLPPKNISQCPVQIGNSFSRKWTAMMIYTPPDRWQALTARECWEQSSWVIISPMTPDLYWSNSGQTGCLA